MRKLMRRLRRMRMVWVSVDIIVWENAIGGELIDS